MDQAVIASGFTGRQEHFLEVVLLHSGRKQHDFFAALRARRLATQYPTAHRRAHLYHVHGRRLYRAIGEPESRHRKPTTLGRAVERLMVLARRQLASRRPKVVDAAQSFVGPQAT